MFTIASVVLALAASAVAVPATPSPVPEPPPAPACPAFLPVQPTQPAQPTPYLTSSTSGTGASANVSSATTRSNTIVSNLTTTASNQAPSTTKPATFLIPTASDASPSASGISVGQGKAYIQYTVQQGFFLQDDNSTNATGFDYATVNFGLLNRTYPTDTQLSTQSQWQRFNAYLSSLNVAAPASVQYKLIFFARHGEGFHNAAETFYGTPAWNCYWAQADGNATAIWSDAALTSNGFAQAYKANAYWTRLINEQSITPPQAFYSSPLTRCLQTAEYTWRNISLPALFPYRPKIREFLREGISIHTCDRRSNKTTIARTFPGYTPDSTFSENDELWSGITAESASAQDYRSKIALDDIFTSQLNGPDKLSSQIVSVTSHSGETGSLLRVLGHRTWSLGTGQIIPVLIKAETITQTPPATTTTAWAASSWCTNAPPVTSTTTGCVCAGGVTPTAVAPSLIFTSRP